MNLPSARTYGGWLAIVRVLTGCIWLLHALPKFLKADMFLPPNGTFATYLQNGIGKTVGPYHDFLVNVVQPNALTFADMVRFGELLVGITLVLGLFTRFGALVGVALTADYIAARGGLSTANSWGSLDACLMLLSAISLVLPTGSVAGIDGLRRPRAPRQQRVVAEVVPERPLDGPRAPQ
ncbi:MAG TPA: TQO small subunit DoxD [Candidatus Cybelea sp.]|jgi:thiosulfate dehydrogenase [quinone] large subunit|nr:TQO small subunit DoxD [Candidatus Cybelea sp.]